MSARRYTLYATYYGHNVEAEDVATKAIVDADGQWVRAEDYDKLVAAIRDIGLAYARAHYHIAEGIRGDLETAVDRAREECGFDFSAKACL